MKTTFIILTIVIIILILVIAAFISTIIIRINDLENNLYMVESKLKEIIDLDERIVKQDDIIIKNIISRLTFIKQNMIRRKTPIIDD